MKNVFNISPVYSFLDVMAEFIVNTAKEHNLNIANDIILLPTKRACREFKNIIVKLNNGTTLLPTIKPIGDVDEDGFAFLEFENENIADGTIPNAIDNIERNLILSTLIKKKNPSLNDEQAFALAVDLAHLMDTVEMEMLDFANLSSIVPENLSQHWQETLEFLQIITAWYPQILKERGYINPVDRKIKLLYKQVEVWKKFPPKGRIFVAGSTGSLIPISYMISEIAKMDNGYVILPHLDKTLSEEDFLNVGQNHPQYGLKNLLLKMKLNRNDVRELSGPQVKVDREKLSSYIMLDSNLKESWYNISPFEQNILNGVSKINFKTDLDETLGIALCIREKVEQNKKTLLITPDRKIAKSVASELRRWNIIVDDSAGTPSSEIDTGNYFILLLNAVIEKFSVVNLLSVLKHKFTHLGYEKNVLEEISNNLEKEILRGNFGLDNLDKIISKAEEVKLEKDEIVITPILQLLYKIKEKTSCFDKFFENKDEKVSLYDLLTLHIKFVEDFVKNDSKEPEFVNNLLYNGDLENQFVEELKGLLKTLLKLKNDNLEIDKMNLKSYRDFISNFMFNIKLRPTDNSHPLVAIMNSIEARLLDADTFIIAGLNEQTFPSVTSDDPWMSRPMKANFKLPLPERKVGLASHDFVEFFCKQNVIMTRSEKVESKNTIESRWLQKLDAVLKISDITFDKSYADNLLYWTYNFDNVKGDIKKCERPAPKPPFEARPKELAATYIEKLYRDPYIIFAQKILKLKKLDDIDVDVMPADFGNIIHNSLQEFKDKQLKTYQEFMNIIMQNALPFKNIDIIDFWYKKFETVARWFIKYEEKMQNDIVNTYTEIEGRLPITENFTLKAKADRIDVLKNSMGIVISDYKTGSAPKEKEVIAGYSPQLLLEAIILNNNGFKAIKSNAKVCELKYLEVCKEKVVSFKNDDKLDLDELLLKSFDALVSIIKQFEDENTPYISRPNPNEVGSTIQEYSEYTHLARVKEWSDTE